ncbi:uncharacterized protein RHOBADRAFT_50968 [Rhodotorula graminis WP1]|uniref:Proteophosphoglycan ppg4 n=1 Tax=Rhodotorula graminis (strain WP1) TaxID=578459 RepID=A0A194SD22_RHOGW|nr:uncharacterized protein RHOBADRAFT_50968 [Rhodotorula graminis WP1]KPV78509.1 hypothetical protein RHOBADRAFT_50968 [Rhodotorula graminis WP1]
MDEPSPWGASASDDLPTFAPRPPSPRRSTYSPPLAASSSFSASTWQDDGDGGWGGAVDDYVPGAFGGGHTSGAGGFTSSNRDDDDGVALPHSNGGAGGWQPDSPELPKFTTITSSAPAADVASPSSPAGFRSSPPLSPTALDLPSFPRDSLDASTARADDRGSEPDDSGGGWGGAEPDLPPVGALRIAAPDSPAADDSRDDGWGPAQEGPDPEDEEPPLPSLGDLFPSAAVSRRQSVELAQKGEQGEDAWGSSQGWEERMRLEAEAREKQRIAEAKAAGIEPEEERKPDTTTTDGKPADDKPADGDQPAAKSGLASIFRFRKTAEDTATRAVESAKETSANVARSAAALANAAARPSSEQEGARASGDAERPTARSWLSRVAAGKEDPGKEDDPNSLGVDEVQQGESGRTTSPEPQPASVFGRIFGRKKAPASEEPQRSTSTSARNSGEQHERQAAPDLRVQDLDALGDSGLVARLQAQAHVKKSMYEYDEDDEDDQPPPASQPSSFFGSSTRGSSTSRVPSAPPEDDFGGLLGAFSVAPSTSSVKAKASSSAFDPFDPLSDSFGALPVPKPAVSSRPVASPSFTRSPPPPTAPSSSRSALSPSLSSRPHPAAQVASFGSPPRAVAAAPQPRASSPQDDFDAFFDSVAVSTGNKVAAPAGSAARVQQQPAIVAPAPASRLAASQGPRARVISPPPRLTVSPPVRMSTASPMSASSGRTTPIMPLAPPPPPSQPLALTRLVGIDAPPAATGASVAQQKRTPSPAAVAPPLAPAPALSPALAASAKARTPSPQPQPQVQRASSGPLSLDDLSFFES